MFLGLVAAATGSTGLARQAREGADAAGWVVTILLIFVIYLMTWSSPACSSPRGGGWKAMLRGRCCSRSAGRWSTSWWWSGSRPGSTATDRYGALGIAILLLGSIYLLGRLIVAAAFVNATMWFRRGTA